MDPQVAWQELLDAFQQSDWDRVHELAEGLLHWMNRRGFPPETLVFNSAVNGGLNKPSQSLGPDWNRSVAQAACRYAVDLANQVLNDPNGIPRRIPFTLSCRNCEINCPSSYEDAVAAGWNDIRFVPQRVAEKFLGLCPDCHLISDKRL